MLLVKAAEEQWVKDTLHHCLIKKNKDEKNAYDQLNLLVNICSWNKVAEAVEVNIAMFAPTMGGELAEWLTVLTLPRTDAKRASEKL